MPRGFAIRENRFRLSSASGRAFYGKSGGAGCSGAGLPRRVLPDEAADMSPFARRSLAPAR